MGRFLQDIFEIPKRQEKPRKKGITVVIDSGWRNARSELVANSAPYFDVVKSTVPCLYMDENFVRKNIEAYRNLGLDVQIAGVCFEIAALQGKEKEYLKKVKEFGINVVEIESHAAGISLAKMKSEVKRYKDQGFKVVGEVGAKWWHADWTRINRDTIDVGKVIESMSQFLEAGADYVYWEGMVIRSLIGNHLENRAGQAQLLEVARAVDRDKVVFEVWSGRGNVDRPLHGWLIHHFGPDINIGNLHLQEIFNLESIRRGLTYDPDHPYLRWLSQKKPTKNWWEIESPDYSEDIEPLT
ncbi:MAG: phosphosulfolactate synthase [Thermodesulfobacteriota bacterium]